MGLGGLIRMYCTTKKILIKKSGIIYFIHCSVESVLLLWALGPEVRVPAVPSTSGPLSQLNPRLMKRCMTTDMIAGGVEQSEKRGCSPCSLKLAQAN